jgi:hypothetical protein
VAKAVRNRENCCTARANNVYKAGKFTAVDSTSPLTGWCRAMLANLYGAAISSDSTPHNQRDARNASIGSSALKRVIVPLMGFSFANACSLTMRSVWM